MFWLIITSLNEVKNVSDPNFLIVININLLDKPGSGLVVEVYV